MPSDWSEARLEDVTTILGDGLHGTPEYDDLGDYYFINGNNLSNGQIVFNDKTRRVGEAEYQRHRKDLNDRTILVSINGTLGNVALYRGEKVVLGKSACYFNVRTEVDKHFLRYVMASPSFQDYIHTLATGTTIKNVSLRLMRDFVFQLPPPELQREISTVLSALDDRIALLRETNATLEAIAQALFKSWFVDFDPVRAKAAGLEPEGMPAEVANLFPSEFEDSELGEIPKGWHVSNVYEVATVRYGAPFGSKHFNNEGDGLPLVRIRDLKDEAPGVWTPEVHPKGYKLQPGDIVVGMDGEFRAHLWGGEEAWLNQRICVFQPSSGHSAAFVRSVIAPSLAHIEATETATTVIHLGKGDIDRFRVIVPPSLVAKAFAEFCQPLYDQIVSGKQRARTLAAIRDTLLPRLMSGKLRIPEARETVEESIA